MRNVFALLLAAFFAVPGIGQTLQPFNLNPSPSTPSATLPSAEELAVRAAYQKISSDIGIAILQKELAKGPLPDNFNLNDAGAPRFIISGFAIGDANNLPSFNSDDLTTLKLSNEGFIAIKDGAASWQTAQQPDVPQFVDAMSSNGVLYSRYAQYTVNVSLAGKSRSYQAMTLFGQDGAGNQAVKAYDSITMAAMAAMKPARSNCGKTTSNSDCGGGGGGTPPYDSAWNMRDGGDGYSMDLLWQPMLNVDNQTGLIPVLVQPQWIDPILMDPLAKANLSPGLGTPVCSQCVQDRETKCSDQYRTNNTWAIATIVASGVGCAVTIVATPFTGGLSVPPAVATCLSVTAALGAGGVVLDHVNSITYNSCMQNVKWDCTAACGLP